jgi:putative methionine-R-sulfoxide reductase with GAF domain
MSEGELGRIYSDGDIIFKEGDIGEAMYVIQSGKINITKKATSGDLVIATLQSGEIFGEMALFDRLPRSATARASGNARILTIDKKKLFSTISRDPTLVFKLLESMSQRIRKLDEELMKLRKSKIDILHVFIDVDETSNLILEEARNIIPAENGSIMLLDDEEKLLSIKAAFGTEWDPKIRLAVGEGIAGDVVKTGKAELINNVSFDPRFKSGESHIKSMLCVPLRWKNNIFGVINMSTSSEKLFALDDLKLLHSVAIHASIAIENSKNFSKIKNVTDEILRHATLLDMW